MHRDSLWKIKMRGKTATVYILYGQKQVYILQGQKHRPYRKYEICKSDQISIGALLLSLAWWITRVKIFGGISSQWKL
jgi:hypothetical protein